MSVFGWLDYDDANRRRMMELVDLFRERGTLDELGIGTIRDAFADRFFPGTSTIQTRVGYFLFIPWIYRHLEEERTSPARMAGRARELQGRLVQSLRAGSRRNERGIIGINAGENLKRPPSVIYWNGLGRWGIRVFDGTIDQYHGSVDALYRSLQAGRRSEGGELVFDAHRNWHQSLPAPPHDWLDSVSFELRAEDSEFLAERIRRSCANTLLCESLSVSRTQLSRTRYPWEIDGACVSAENHEDLEHARRFAVMVQGAMLLYNLMLAEHASERQLATGGDNVERYRTELAVWADHVVGMRDDFREWDLAQFQTRVRSLNPGVAHRSIEFFNTWASWVIADPRSVPDIAAVRQLISQRERVLKGSLARLHAPRALEQWSGASGLGLLDFRWGQSKQMIIEILDGLNRARKPA